MQTELIKAALTPDHHSQAAYTGRIIQREEFTVIDGEGNPIHVERDVVITWDTIKAVIALIRKRIKL